MHAAEYMRQHKNFHSSKTASAADFFASYLINIQKSIPF